MLNMLHLITDTAACLWPQQLCPWKQNSGTAFFLFGQKINHSFAMMHKNEQNMSKILRLKSLET